MEIKTLVLGHIQTNCYFLISEKAAIVIDPGFNSSIIEEFLKENSHKERLILLTHSHFDHIGAAPFLRETTGVKIAIGEYDNPALSDGEKNLSNRFHAHLPPFSADILLSDTQEFLVEDIKFKVIFTPGHTVGSVCYLCENVLFSGDTLFYESIGRTDFPGGDFKEIKKSLEKVLSLDENVRVLPGHFKETTIAYEKIFNPYIGY